MKTSAFMIVVVALLASALILVGNVRVGMAQGGIVTFISSDTTWTKANSPHILSGPIFVNNGVTLTVEAGATVNFNNYYITVNGTLNARGSSTDQIRFNGGSITFIGTSSAWNEQTGSGSIIENSILTSTSVFGGSPKINRNSINAAISVDSTATISNNVITGSISGGSTVLNNVVIGTVSGGLVENNTITGEVYAGGSSVISGNTISGGGVSCAGNSRVSNNVIFNSSNGVTVSSQFFQSGGYPVIEKNLIRNNTNGINVGILIRAWVGTNIPIIENNTIFQNSVGIRLSYVNQEPSHGYPLPTIRNNNILNNSNYNFYLDTSEVNINATQNWWGTTDAQAVNLTIRDYKYDLTLGTVYFIPFLTEPNPTAPLIFTPFPPVIPEYPSMIMLMLLFTATIPVAVRFRRKLELTK